MQNITGITRLQQIIRFLRRLRQPHLLRQKAERAGSVSLQPARTETAADLLTQQLRRQGILQVAIIFRLLCLTQNIRLGCQLMLRRGSLLPAELCYFRQIRSSKALVAVRLLSRSNTEIRQRLRLHIVLVQTLVLTSRLQKQLPDFLQIAAGQAFAHILMPGKDKLLLRRTHSLSKEIGILIKGGANRGQIIACIRQLLTLRIVINPVFVFSLREFALAQAHNIHAVKAQALYVANLRKEYAVPAAEAQSKLHLPQSLLQQAVPLAQRQLVITVFRNLVITHKLLHSLQHSILATQAGQHKVKRHALLMQAAQTLFQRQRLHKLHQLLGIFADGSLRLSIFYKSIQLLPQLRCIPQQLVCLLHSLLTCFEIRLRAQAACRFHIHIKEQTQKLAVQQLQIGRCRLTSPACGSKQQAQHNSQRLRHQRSCLRQAHRHTVFLRQLAQAAV